MLSYEDYQKVMSWVKEKDTHRSVDIKYSLYDNNNPTFSCWLWDYEAIEGVHYESGMYLPTTEELKVKRKASLLKQFEEL